MCQQLSPGKVCLFLRLPAKGCLAGAAALSAFLLLGIDKPLNTDAMKGLYLASYDNDSGEQ